MRERYRDWRPAWLFALWALLLGSSLAGGNWGTAHKGSAHSDNDHGPGIGSFAMAANGAVQTTTRESSR